MFDRKATIITDRKWLIKSAEDAEDAEDRTWRAWVEDGLEDLVTGAVSLAWAVLALSWYRLPLWVSSVCLIATLILSRRWVIAAKARLTDRRTGYQRFREPPERGSHWKRAIVFGLVVALVDGLIGAVTRAAPSMERYLNAEFFMPVMFMALWLVPLAHRTRLRRYYAMLLVLLAAAVFAPGFGFREQDALFVLFAVQGLLLVASGGFALVTYLRKHPATVEQ